MSGSSTHSYSPVPGDVEDEDATATTSFASRRGRKLSKKSNSLPNNVSMQRTWYLEAYLRLTWGLLEAYLRRTWGVLEAYLRRTWGVLEAYLRRTWGVLEAYLSRTHSWVKFCMLYRNKYILLRMHNLFSWFNYCIAIYLTYSGQFLRCRNFSFVKFISWKQLWSWILLCDLIPISNWPVSL